MSFEEAIMSVLPSDSWKKLHCVAEDLRGVEIDSPKPEAIEPYLIHPVISQLVERGLARRQPAMHSPAETSHSGFEYQRA